jgi:hypothetical protein
MLRGGDPDRVDLGQAAAPRAVPAALPAFAPVTLPVTSAECASAGE